MALGSKVADPCRYGHTQFHLIPDRLKRENLIKKNLAHQIEVVNRANGIASLFAWTAAQAMYQGETKIYSLIVLGCVTCFHFPLSLSFST